MRLIDADALKARIEKYGGIFERCRACINGDCATCVVENMDKIAPTIDAVPVVRCKDCIHSESNMSANGLRLCDLLAADVADNDYCFWGERGLDE